MLTMLLTTANVYEDAKRCVQFCKLVSAPACLIVCKVLLVYYVKGSFSVSVWLVDMCLHVMMAAHQNVVSSGLPP